MATRAVPALLLRAWLFAAALAVIAGLLGMHVLTSGHASHGAMPHGAMSQGAPQHGAAPHSTASHASHAPAPAAVDTTDPGPDACGDSCPAVKEPGAPCVPSAPGGPLTISPPQATLAVLPLLPPGGTAGSGYSYVPPGPTPCGLSISRT